MQPVRSAGVGFPMTGFEAAGAHCVYMGRWYWVGMEADYRCNRCFCLYDRLEWGSLMTGFEAAGVHCVHV